MGYSEACDVKVGDRIWYGGLWRDVISVMHHGRCWPYYQLKSKYQTDFSYAGLDWVSWQECGKQPAKLRS